MIVSISPAAKSFLSFLKLYVRYNKNAPKIIIKMAVMGGYPGARLSRPTSSVDNIEMYQYSQAD